MKPLHHFMKSVCQSDDEQKTSINHKPEIIELRRNLIVATIMLVTLLVILTRF